MKTIFDRCIESVALMIFLIYIQVMEMAVRSDWLLPYLLSTIVGLGATLYKLYNNVLLNRLLLGITLYFCSGFAGLLFGWDWLNDLYGQLGAVAMLCWILITGITSLLNPFGFLGVETQGYFSVMQCSLMMLLVCVVSILFAVWFMHNKWLGEWLPFIFLFSMRSLLLQLDKKLIKVSVAVE